MWHIAAKWLVRACQFSFLEVSCSQSCALHASQIASCLLPTNAAIA